MKEYFYLFLKWYANSPYASYARTFLSIVAGFAVADFAKAGFFDFSNWQTWFIAALVAFVAPVSRVNNSKDPLHFSG